MAGSDSVKKILERSRMLREQTAAMVADRRMQAFQPSYVGTGRMTSMLDRVRSEVVSSTTESTFPAFDEICFQRELRRENKSLKLQMQQLYSAMLDVSHRLFQDSVYEQDPEVETEVDGYLEERSSMKPVQEQQKIQGYVVHGARTTTSPALENGACHSSRFEDGEENWFQDLDLEMGLTTPLNDHPNNAISHWAGAYRTQTMILS
jgi:hypothetical protein